MIMDQRKRELIDNCNGLISINTEREKVFETMQILMKFFEIIIFEFLDSRNIQNTKEDRLKNKLLLDELFTKGIDYIESVKTELLHSLLKKNNPKKSNSKSQNK